MRFRQLPNRSSNTLISRSLYREETAAPDVNKEQPGLLMMFGELRA